MVNPTVDCLCLLPVVGHSTAGGNYCVVLDVVNWSVVVAYFDYFSSLKAQRIAGWAYMYLCMDT